MASRGAVSPDSGEYHTILNVHEIDFGLLDRVHGVTPKHRKRMKKALDNQDITPQMGATKVPGRGSRRVRYFLFGTAGLVLLATLVAGGYVLNLARIYNDNTQVIESAFPEESNRPQAQGAAPGKAALNILVMGSDSRGESIIDTRNGAATDQRADTLMLVHIPADRKDVYGISLMRDLWVELPGREESKINSALALGGVPLVVQTVESLFGQRIDHVMMMDFAGFKGLTEALGGVDVNVSVPFTSSDDLDIILTPGVNTLDGREALAFVRERYAFADGDYQRVRNQQIFLKGAIGKSLSAETVTNPIKVHNLLEAVSPFVSVDKDLNAAAMGALVLDLKDINPQNLYTFTIPTLGVGTSSDGQSIVLQDSEAIREIAAALASESLGDYVAANHLENGN